MKEKRDVMTAGVVPSKTWVDTRGKDKPERWTEKVELGKFKDGKFIALRPVGNPMPVRMHWIPVKKKDGTLTKFPVVCCDFDPETESLKEERRCPACNIETIQTQRFYIANFIVRSLQEEKPANAKPYYMYPAEVNKKYREVDDESWSPIRVFRIPVSVANALKDISTLNVHKVDGVKKSFPIEHPDYGCDVLIKFDSSQEASSMYNVQKGEHTPLTKEEREYKLFNLDIFRPPDPESLRTDLINLGLLSPKGESYLSRNKLLSFADEVGIKKSKAERLSDRELKELILEMYDPTVKYSDELVEFYKSNIVIDDEEEDEIVVNDEKSFSRLDDILEIEEESEDSEEDTRKPVRKPRARKPKASMDCPYNSFGNYLGKKKCFSCDVREDCLSV